MCDPNENNKTWLKRNWLFVRRNFWNVLIILITTGPVMINGWWDIYGKFIDAMEIPINAVVVASYSPSSEDMITKNDPIKFPIYVSVFLKNHGSDTIENVQFDFATASIINVDFGRKKPPIKDEYKRFLSLGKLQSQDQVFISMRTNIKEKNLHGPEEITNAIIKDFNIRHDGKPGVGNLISYYSDEGKEKYKNYNNFSD